MLSYSSTSRPCSPGGKGERAPGVLSKALEVLSEAPDAMLTALALMWRLPVLGKALILVIIENYPKKGCGRGGD